MVLNLINSMVQVIIRRTQHLIISYLRFLGGVPSQTHNHDTVRVDHLTVIIEDSTEIGKKNFLYAATRTYILSKTNLESVEECNFEDEYQGVELKWRILVDKKNTGNKEWFELRIEEKHRDFVFDSYLPYLEDKAKEIKSKMRTPLMYIFSPCSDTWETKSLKSLDKYHSTFETIVMKEELKRGLIHDLDRFTRRKDFYKKVGAHWMRNYLLHGPPGTGKTSLVAAMAKYLNFDVFNLKMLEVMKSDFDPRNLIRGVMYSSIIVVEDIDCSLEGSTVALSQLLSCLYGLWSNGEARILIFTTDNKESLDPTFLRRMDMQIYMGHCCFEGFKTLAYNYLGLSEDNDAPHRLYPDIKRLIEGLDVTPGQVVHELMKSQDVDVSLEGLLRTLQMNIT